jgi:hypothetical protein
MSIAHLNGHHRKALASLMRRPASHNVEWHDVLSLLNHVGTVTERHNGVFEVKVGDLEIDLDRPKGKDLEGEQVRDLRSFLVSVGLSSGGSAQAGPPDPFDEEVRTWIAVVDHHQAKLFDVPGERSDPIAPIVLAPNDDDGSGRRLEHRQGNDDHDGGHSSGDAEYYERICDRLKPATRIMVLTDGKGRSSAGEYLIGYLKRHHADTARRIVATGRIDIAHSSDREIVAAGLALLPAVLSPQIS